MKPPIFDLLTSVVLSLCLAALVTHWLVPVMVRLAALIGALDHPGGRRRLERPVPRIGGLAIVAGFVVGAGFVLLALWYDELLTVGRREIYSIGFATFLVLLVGLVDDWIGVSVVEKFIAQFAAAWLVVQVGWVFEVVRLPLIGAVDLGPFQVLVTVLWIVGVTNAINFVDGLDGLAGGVVAIISTSFLACALLQGRVLTVVWIAAIVGACLGFLRHNWAPARIFMGDSGSLTLGFLLAIISVHSALKGPVAVAILVPILALGVPVIDTLLVMKTRFQQPAPGGLAERFSSMFQADQRHLHHLLLGLGSRQRIVTAIYGLVLFFCLASLWVAIERNPALGLLLVAVEFAVIVGLRKLGIGAPRRDPPGGDSPGPEAAEGLPLSPSGR